MLIHVLVAATLAASPQLDSRWVGTWNAGGSPLSNPPETPALEPVEPFSITRSSNGSPIINAMGREYSRCQ